jgi:hypothetical protein
MPPWARPPKRGALSHLSGKVGHALPKGARPSLVIKQCAKNLEWMEEWPNPDQLAETEQGLTHTQQRLFLACLDRNPGAEGDV